jgi:AcrR family transcriptional regulator
VGAALELLDRDGADGFSMRRLADELDAKPMSLYSHVADKDDVLDGVYELILSEVKLPDLDRVAWQQWVMDGWGAYRRALLSHARATAAVARRPRSTRSGTFVAIADASLGALRKSGLGVEHALHVQRALSALTLGLAIGEINWREGQVSSGAAAPVLIPAGDFPHFTEALPLILRMEFEATFDYAVALIIAAVEAHVEQTRADS